MAQVKVGDQVRILEGASGRIGDHIGETLTVIERPRGLQCASDEFFVQAELGPGVVMPHEYELVARADEVEPAKPTPQGACQILSKAASTIAQRGTQRDGAGEERSMERTVNTFNAMTGHNLSEEDGWLFMRYLKDSRSRKGNYTFDDYLDGVAYAALQAECADRNNNQ